MALNTKRSKPTLVDVERVINAGGSTPKNDVLSTIENDGVGIDKDVRFTVSMPAELAVVIDKLRRPTKTSRQAWLLQAAHEKLEREGKI